jgi:hypothetical protein
LLKFCYVPATSAAHNRLLFLFNLLQPFTVLMKQTRKAVRAIKQSIFLDVYGSRAEINIEDLVFNSSAPLTLLLPLAKGLNFFCLI